uniref:Uncharacterized protein n=1 Tax=Anguilla anguilla TaxID=7936 RepID=A0A0E9X1I0_ANGAN
MVTVSSRLLTSLPVLSDNLLAHRAVCLQAKNFLWSLKGFQHNLQFTGVHVVLM